MTYFKYLIYGLIQGITEFLPISSTAHLKVLSETFGIGDPGTSVSAILQLGSVFAIAYYFRKEICIYISSEQKNLKKIFYKSKLIKSISIGSIPILFLGGMIKLFIPNFSDSNLRTNFSIALVSILMAFLMLIAEKSKQNKINLNNHRLLDSLKIGLGQALAIVPGVSRSGITISIALLLGWNRKDATKFSFLLGVPAISAAALVEILDPIAKNDNILFFPLLLGLITTFISSYICIKILIKFIPLNGLKIFAYYRIIFGGIILLSYF